MTWLRALLVAGACAIAVPPASAAEGGGHGHLSPYAGEESRQIKSLSAADIDDLLNGRGWGLAKAAELNGMPGPTHVLDMRQEIALSEAQAEEIERIRLRMQEDAVRVGRRLVEQEAALDRAFASGTVTEASLQEAIEGIERTRAELRYIHLSAHLELPGILTPEQVRTYNRLRGYASADSCANPPPGHDAELWRRHNGCN